MTNKNALIRKKTKRTVLYLLLSIWALINLFPLIWLVDFSLAKDNELFSSSLLVFSKNPQWTNYMTAWVQGHIFRFAINSLLVAVVTVIFTVVFAFMLSYAFVRMKWKLSRIVMSFMLIGMMLPIHITLLPNFLIFRKIGILDTPWALIIPYVAFSIPFGVFIMIAFMVTIPKSLEEVAVMDGASIYRIIFEIVAPITKPASQQLLL